MRLLSARAARLPLRVRLVAGFSATMLLVLVAAGAFVYWRVSFALDRQVNEDLANLSGRLAPLVTPAGGVLGERAALDSTDGYQVLDSSGRVLSFSASIGAEPLLDASQARAALTAPLRLDVGPLLPITPRPLRAYAVPLPQAQGRAAAALVVAVARNHRDEALRELLAQLAVAGLGALVLTALVGYLLARLALKPVERYRSRAADIVAGAAGVRLDVPADRDDEITRLGHTLNSMLEALESALERERRFVNDASHELRTPITLLTTRTQLALRRPRTVAEHEQVLAEIQTDLVRLTRLAEQLLTLGSPAPGSTAEESTDVAALVRETLARRNSLGRTDGSPAGAAFVAVESTGPVEVALDPVSATQLLNNLLDNAVLHGRPPIIVAVDLVGDAGRLMVVDDGEGMEPSLLATATHRFTRSTTSRSRPGFGLGLSLVDGIVARAGGELRLCCRGVHQRSGHPYSIACDHGPEMTVTVLLPLVGARTSERALMSLP